MFIEASNVIEHKYCSGSVFPLSLMKMMIRSECMYLHLRVTTRNQRLN